MFLTSLLSSRMLIVFLLILGYVHNILKAECLGGVYLAQPNAHALLLLPGQLAGRAGQDDCCPLHSHKTVNGPPIMSQEDRDKKNVSAFFPP